MNFDTKTASLSVDPGKIIVLRVDQPGVDAEMDTDTGSISFLCRDGTEPARVTGQVALLP